VPKPDFSAAAIELKDAAGTAVGQFSLGGAGVAAEGDVSVPKPDFGAAADELKDAAGSGAGAIFGSSRPDQNPSVPSRFTGIRPEPVSLFCYTCVLTLHAFLV
jgi:hypothetical protein